MDRDAEQSNLTAGRPASEGEIALDGGRQFPYLSWSGNSGDSGGGGTPRRSDIRGWLVRKTSRTVSKKSALIVSCAAGVTSLFGVPVPGHAKDADDLLIVDCLLPGRIQRLGTAATYVTARRAIKTSAQDCRVRGGEYTEADKASFGSLMSVWLALARAGDAEAQTNLGEIFERGLGGPPQPDLAVEWYRQAASQGSARAQVNLGSLYERGIGVPRDPAKALEWYRKASGLADLSFSGAGQPDTAAIRQERDDLARQLEAERSKRRQLERELEQVNQQLQGNRTSLRDQERQLDAARRELSQREADLARRQAHVPAGASGGNDAEAKRQLADLQRLLDDQRKSVADRDAELSRLRASMQTLEQRSDDLKGALAQSEQRRQADVASAQNEVSAARQELAQVSEKLQRANADLGERMALIAQQREEAEKLRRQLEAQGGQSAASRADRAALQASLRKAEAELGKSQQEVTRLNAQIASLEGQFTTATRANGGASATPPPAPRALNVDFGNYVALVIGNNNYRNGPKLRTAVNDAKAVADVLKRRYGFETVVLIDADRYQILSALNKLRERLTSKDNLLVYYAGHGELDPASDRGYWLPVDAEQDSNANWIASYQITDILKAMSAKQIMLVADSCFSGMLTRSAMTRLGTGMTESEKQQWYQTMSGKHARVVLTSGGVQPVSDAGAAGHSVFAGAFLAALQSNSDILEGQKLAQMVTQRVAIAPAAKLLEQVPIYAPLGFAGHEAGDFFFVPSR